MPDRKLIGERLRRLRGNLSRSFVANACGISVSALSMYENGDRMPRDNIKVRFAKLFGKSVQYIFFSN
nr:MAG TPA: Helix-turn-helix XRE-family like protein [Caudoviricetes sp.]